MHNVVSENVASAGAAAPSAEPGPKHADDGAPVASNRLPSAFDAYAVAEEASRVLAAEDTLVEQLDVRLRTRRAVGDMSLAANTCLNEFGNCPADKGFGDVLNLIHWFVRARKQLLADASVERLRAF